MAHYFRSTGSNWGTVGDWSSTASPTYTAVAAVPTAADDVIFEAASANCIVNSINRVCKTINFTNYTNTIQMTFNITVSGAVTFGASMNVHAIGSGIMIQSVTSTLTSNGYIWPNEYRFNGTNQTFTIASDMTFGGVLSTTGAATLVTLAGNRTITCNSGVTATIGLAGTGTIIRIAGGTTSGTFSTTDLVLYSGTITLGNIFKTGATFTYTAGTVNATGSTLTLNGTVALSLGSNVVFGAGSFTSGGSYTFNDDLWIAGNLNLAGAAHASTYISSTNKTLYIHGLSGTSNNNEPTGLSVNKPQIVFNGTGNWSYTGNFSLNTTINTAGTLTIIGQKNLGSTSGSANLTYISGTIVYSSTLLNNFGNNTLDCSGMTWPAIKIGSFNRTTTLLSDLNCSGTLTLAGTSAIFIYNGFNINTNSLSIVGTNLNISGTTNIVLNPSISGTWSHTNQPSSFTIPLIIDAVGTLTLSGTLSKNGSLTYTAGTIISTGSILSWAGIMTINATGFNLDNLLLIGTSYFQGSQGFTIATLNNTTAGVHSVWQVGNEYIITTNFISGQVDAINRITYTSSDNKIFTASIAGTTLTISANIYGTVSIGQEVFATGLTQGFTITSFGTGAGGTGTYNLSGAPGNLTSRTMVASSGTASYPKITLNSGAFQSLYFSNALDIDSLNGQTIWTFQSNLLRAFNWALGSQPTTFSYTWVS